MEKGIQAPMAEGRSTKIIQMKGWIRTSRLSIKNFLSQPQVYGLLLLVHTTPAYILLFVIFSLANQLYFSTFFSFAANTFGYVRKSEISDSINHSTPFFKPILTTHLDYTGDSRACV
jgi:hypothetical protein